MNDFVAEASVLWNLDLEESVLFAARENQVYKLTDINGKQYALRVHRQGYTSTSELESELSWMKILSEQGLSVPTPYVSQHHNLFETVNGHTLDLLDWLDGAPLGKTGQLLNISNRQSIFHLLGKTIARLHQLSDNWEQPPQFTKRAWSSDGLVGERPVWGKFWENPSLNKDQKALLLEARSKAQAFFTAFDGTLDYGLIHADTVRENILIHQGKVRLIDFDDSGNGYRLFDIASALIKNENEPDYHALRNNLIAGYNSVRAIDTQHLELFIALRSFTYVGWIITRLDEDGGQERNKRFIVEALRKAEKLVSAY